MAKAFPKGFLVCFHCNQTGHQKAECPQLTHGSAQAPAPTTLQVTDGRPRKAEALRARGRAFQLTAEDICASPDVVAGMYLFILLVFMIHSYLYCA